MRQKLRYVGKNKSCEVYLLFVFLSCWNSYVDCFGTAFLKKVITDYLSHLSLLKDVTCNFVLHFLFKQKVNILIAGAEHIKVKKISQFALCLETFTLFHSKKFVHTSQHSYLSSKCISSATADCFLCSVFYCCCFYSAPLVQIQSFSTIGRRYHVSEKTDCNGFRIQPTSYDIITVPTNCTPNYLNKG